MDSVSSSIDQEAIPAPADKGVRKVIHPQHDVEVSMHRILFDSLPPEPPRKRRRGGKIYSVIDLSDICKSCSALLTITSTGLWDMSHTQDKGQLTPIKLGILVKTEFAYPV